MEFLTCIIIMLGPRLQYKCYPETMISRPTLSAAIDCIFGDLNSYLNSFCMKEILESKVQDCQDGSRDGADLQCYLDGCYRATISWLLQ